MSSPNSQSKKPHILNVSIGLLGEVELLSGDQGEHEYEDVTERVRKHLSKELSSIEIETPYGVINFTLSNLSVD